MQQFDNTLLKVQTNPPVRGTSCDLIIESQSFPAQVLKGRKTCFSEWSVLLLLLENSKTRATSLGTNGLFI